MAASTGQINVEALDTVLKAIGTTYNALKVLDAQMDATLINKFAKLAQGVNQFVNALSRISLEVSITDGIKKVQELFKGIAELKTTMDSIGALDETGLTKFSNAIYRFTLALQQSADVDLSKSLLIKGIVNIYNTLGKAFTEGPAISSIVVGLDGLLIISKSLVMIMNSLGKVNTDVNVLAGVSSTIKALVSAYTNLAKTFAVTTDSATLLSGLANIKDVFKTLLSIIVTLPKLVADPAATNSIATTISQLVNVYTAFNASFTATGSEAVDTTALLANFANFKTIIKAVVEVIKGLPTKNLDLSQLSNLQAAFGQIMTFYIDFGKIVAQQADDSTASLTANLLKALGSLVSGIGDFFSSRASKGFLGSLGDILAFRLALGQTVVVMRNIIATVAGLDTSRVDAIASFAKGMGAIFTGLADFFKLLLKSDIFNFNLLDFVKRLIQIRLALIPIGLVLDTLKPIFKAAGQGEAKDVAEFTKAVASIFESLTGLFDTFSRRENTAGYGTILKTWLALKAVLQPVGSIIDQFRKVPKGVDFSGLGAIFEAIGKFADPNSIKNFGNLNSLDLSGLTNVGKQISNLIASFGGLDADAIKRIDAIAKLIEIIPQLDKLKELGAGGGGSVLQAFAGVKSIAEQVADGVKSAVFQLGLFYAGFQVIKTIVEAFNPVAIIGYFNDIGNRVNDLIIRVKDAFTQIQALGTQLKGFGEGLISSYGIGNITSSDVFKTTVEFDKLGSSLEVFGGLTKAQRKDAEDYANVLGKEYPLSANEALKATLDLVKAGQSAESAKSILGPAADLASLSDSGSIENATSFIIQATSAFKDFNDVTKASYENSAVAVNIISAAADSSTASVESLAEGLKAVGPVASGFGLSLEETTAALAIFTDGGLSGAAAGTQLKSILTNLTTTTAKKELKKLGVQLSDTAGNIRPLNDILNDIQKKFTQTGTVVYTTTKKLAGPAADQLKAAENALASATRQQFLIGNDLNATGLGKNADKKLNEAKQIADNATAIITQLTGSASETEKITANIKRSELQNAESLKKIAGSYGQAGLAILLAQGQDGLKGFMEQMDAVAPASVRAQKALDNIAGDMIQLQGSVETLTTKALAPLLEKFFRPFVQVGRFFIDTLLTVNDSVIEFITTAGVLTSTLLTGVGAFAIFTGAIIEFGGAILSAFAFFATSVPQIALAFIGGIAGFAAGIIALAGAFAILAPVIITVTEGFQVLYKVFSENLGGAADQAQHFGARVAEALGQVGTAIGQILDFVVELVSGGGLGSLDDVGKGIGGFFNSLSLAVTRFETSGAGKTLSDIGNLFAGFTKALSFNSGTQKAADDAVGAIDYVNEGFTGRSAREASKARKAFAKEYAGFITSLINNNGVLKSILGDNLTSADVQKYLEKAVGFVQSIRAGLGDVFGSFGKAFASAQEVLKGGGNLGQGIATFVGELGKNLDKSLGSLSGTVLTALSELFHFDSGDLAKIFSVQGFGAGVGELIQRGLKAALQFVLSNRGAIGDLFTGLFDFFIVGGLNQAANTLRTLGATGLADLIASIAGVLRGAFRGIIDTIFNLLEGNSIADALVKAFGPGIQPIIDLITAIGTMGKLIGDIIGKIVSAFSPAQTAAATKGSGSILDTLNDIIKGITGFISFINGALSSLAKSINLSGILGTIGKVIGDVVKGVQNLFKNLFGGADVNKSLSDSLRPISKTIPNVFEETFQNVLAAITGIFKDFDLGKLLRGIFEAIPQALKNVNSILGKGAGAVFDVFANIFNFKDAFLSASLKGGGLLNGIKVILNRAIKGITGFLAAHGAEIRDGFTNFFTGAFQGLFNIGATITKALGLNDLSKAFGGIAEAVPNFFKNLFGLIFDVINGKDLATALLDTFGPGVQPILDFVKGLQGAATQIQTFAQGIIDALFKPAIPGGEPPVVVFIRSIGDAFGKVITFLQTQVLAPLQQGNAGLALSNLAQGVLNLANGIASAIATEIRKLDLPTVFKNVADAVLEGIGSALSSGVQSIGTSLGFDATSFINQIDTTIAAAVKAIGTGDAGTIFTAAAGSIINLLITALGTAVAGIASLAGFDASGFLASLDSVIKSNLDAVAGSNPLGLVTSTISGLVSSAIAAAFNGLADLAGIDPGPALAKIQDATKNFVDAFGVFSGTDGQPSIFDNIAIIVGKIVDAFKSLIDLFKSGDTTTATDNAQGFKGALQIVVDVLGNIENTSLNTLADLIKGIGDFFDALAKSDPQTVIAVGAAIGLFADYYFGLGLVASVSTGITSIVAFLGFIAAQGGVSAAALSLLGPALTIFSNGIQSVLNSIVGKAAAFVVIVEFFRAIAQNVRTFVEAFHLLTQGDLGGAIRTALQGIVNVFVDLGFNLAELLGITTIVGKSRAAFKAFADQGIAIIGAFADLVRSRLETEMFAPIDDFINGTVPLLLSNLEEIGVRAKAALGDTSAGALSKGFDLADSLTFNKDGFSAITDDLNDAGTVIGQSLKPVWSQGLIDQLTLAGPDAIERARLNAKAGKTQISQVFLEQMARTDLTPSQQAEFLAQNVKAFNFLGLSDEILANVAKSGDKNLLQGYLTEMLNQGIKITPEMQAAFTHNIVEGFTVLDTDAAKGKIGQLDIAIETFAKLNLDTTQLQAERDRLQGQIDTFIKAGQVPTDTPVDTSVTPVITTNPARNPDGSLYTGPLAGATGTSVGNGATSEVPVDFKIKPNFKKLDELDTAQVVPTAVQQLQTALASDPSGLNEVNFDATTLSDPKKVEDFNKLIEDLTTNVKSLASELNGLTSTQTIVTTTLTNIQISITTFRDVTVPLFGEVNTAATPIAGSVQAINNALISLFFTATIGFPAMAASAFVSVGSITLSFLTLSNAANTNLQNVINKVTELATGFRNAAAAAALVKLPDGTTGTGTGGGDGKPPGRGGGGSTKPYSVYEVHDTKSPEIYNDGKRSLLLTGNQSGYVTNLSDMPSLGSNRSTGYPGRVPQAAGPTFNANNITINEGTISVTVQVQGGAAASPQKIAEAVKTQVADMQSRLPVNKLGSILRSFHK